MKKHLLAFLQLIPVILSMLLIAAHFFRAGNFIFIVLSLVLLFALFIRHPLAARIMQLALFLSSAEWVRTAFVLASARFDAGLPWLRLVLILGTVAFFTVASLFVFLSNTLKDRYRLK